MESNPCSKCFESTRSTLDLVKMLNSNWSACEKCAHKPVMRVLAEQFQKQRPLWWMVGGVSVVPRKIVEYFGKHPPGWRRSAFTN